MEQNGIPQLHASNETTSDDDEEEKFSFPDSELPECELTAICLRAFEHGREGVALHCFTYKPVYEEEIRKAVVDQAEIRNVVVHQGCDEKQMLNLFVKYLEDEQFDVDVGWNTLNFDWQAIHIRCQMHGVSLCRVGKVELWKDPPLMVKKSNTQSRGNTQIKMFEIPGMIHHDLLRIWREDHKERSYGLEAVSNVHLGQHKLPIEPNQITSWAKQADPMGLTKVTIYCAQDTKLPEALAKKYRKLLNLIMFCNVSQTLPNVFIQRGSNVRTMNLVGARMERKGIVNEDIPHSFNQCWKKYQGACVLDPIRGKHDEPIATLDFAGLYPANMNSQYIDFMRWVDIGGVYDNLEGVKYKDVEWVDVVWDDDTKQYDRETVKQRYVVGEGHISLMPTLMSELRKERKTAKKEVKKYKQLAANTRNDGKSEEADEYELLVGVWDANQLAIKLLMNAGYGFLGTPLSPLPHRGLAMCVTRYGRFMLEQAQRYTLARYATFDNVTTMTKDRTDEHIHTIAQGRSLEDLRRDAKGFDIVYGDTDSIMCKWALPDDLKCKLNGDVEEQNEVLRWVFDKAKEASLGATKYINRHFCHDTVWGEDGEIKEGSMDLEFEKVFFPSHFYQMKRYLYRKIADKPDVTTGKVDAQGMAMVRRDISKISRDLLWKCANAYMSRDDEMIKSSMITAFEQLAEMAKCIGDPAKIDMSVLEVTKQLAANYRNQPWDKAECSIPAHAVVARKLKASHRGENPMPGDRIGYVQIIDPGLKKSQAVDAVKYIVKEKLPVDIKLIAEDMLGVLQQVIDKDSGIIVTDVVERLMQQIDATQGKYFAKIVQTKTGNLGLMECGVKRGREDAVVRSAGASVENVIKKQKKINTSSKDGNLRSLFKL